MCIEEGINIKCSQLSSSLDGGKEKSKKEIERKENKEELRRHRDVELFSD